MVMSYFYVSEIYGAISTPYIINSGYEIIFGFSLLLFTFFSILAGNFLSSMAGFLGEFLFQFIFYEKLFWDWIILIAIYGFICGSYKYRPLKYSEGMKIYYTFLLILILAFICMLFIPFSQILFYTNPLNVEEIFINYGFKFLTQSLVTTVFLIPLLLFLYDKLLASEKREVYNILLTHHTIDAADHTFYLEFGRTKIYFCSRCSGIVIGAIFSVFVTHIFDLIDFHLFNAEISFIICIIIPLIALADWGTQRLMYRKSSTESRLLTGILIGVAWRLLLYTEKYYFIMMILITIYFGILFFLMYLGNRKMINKMNNELDAMVESEEEHNVIFVHGLESSGHGFKGNLFRTIIPEIFTPDFYEYSEKISIDSLLEKRMNQLNRILEEKSNWIIIGSSFGGLMATLYSLQNPGKVKQLVLLAPFINTKLLSIHSYSPIDIPVIVYHGKNDEIISAEASQERAKVLFRNLQFNLVEDDHQLHKTVVNINWNSLLSL